MKMFVTAIEVLNTAKVSEDTLKKISKAIIREKYKSKVVYRFSYNYYQLPYTFHKDGVTLYWIWKDDYRLYQ